MTGCASGRTGLVSHELMQWQKNCYSFTLLFTFLPSFKIAVTFTIYQTRTLVKWLISLLGLNFENQSLVGIFLGCAKLKIWQQLLPNCKRPIVQKFNDSIVLFPFWDFVLISTDRINIWLHFVLVKQAIKLIFASFCHIKHHLVQSNLNFWNFSNLLVKVRPKF